MYTQTAQGSRLEVVGLRMVHCCTKAIVLLACHGSQGQGGRAIELTGDRLLLNSRFPDRGIAVSWPYAPGLFEYVRRSMPPANPWSLTPNETYSVVAFLLDINELAADDAVVDKNFLSELVVPNVEGFRDSALE